MFQACFCVGLCLLWCWPCDALANFGGSGGWGEESCAMLFLLMFDSASWFPNGRANPEDGGSGGKAGSAGEG